MNKKRNQIFNYLYVLAIIMVIDDHTGGRIGILSNIFPYNSFYMPLFVFCSGYFYKKDKPFKNVLHKVRKILIPYIIWNIIALGIAFFLDRIFKVDWCQRTDIIYTIKHWMIFGSSTTLNRCSLVYNYVILGINII